MMYFSYLEDRSFEVESYPPEEGLGPKTDRTVQLRRLGHGHLPAVAHLFILHFQWMYLLKVFEWPELYKRFQSQAAKFEGVHTKFKVTSINVS